MMSLTYVKGKIVTPKFNENKYTLGSGVGRTSTSNRRALQRRAAHKKLLHIFGNYIEGRRGPEINRSRNK